MVLNAVSGKVENEFTGLYFSWSPDHQTLAHVGWILHFAAPASQNFCVLFNDKPVYTPGCTNEARAAPKKSAPPARKDAGVKRGNSTATEPAHYQDIHQIYPPLLWSPNGRDLAFVESVYDFDWGMDDKGDETREIGNSRLFLAIISGDHPAVGYSLTPPLENPQWEWLDSSRIEVKGNSGGKPFERTFDLANNPPKEIP